MPKYVIEREIAGSDKFSAEQLQDIAQKSCDVLNEMGPRIQWIQSFVTANKWYCVYIAHSKEVVLEHAKRGAFPANAINEVVAVVDPVSAEGELVTS